MRRELNAWTIYHYLVCFVTLMMVIVGTVQMASNLLDYFLPARVPWPTLESVGMRLGPEADEETIRRIFEEERSQSQQDMRHRQVRSAFNSLAWIAVALPIYILHWRRITRHESTPS